MIHHADPTPETLPEKNISPERMAQAARIIGGGGIVAVPTETVYGLAANATHETGVRRIFRAKGRPACNPLIVHVSDISMAARYAVIPREAHMLAARFWPGPLTLVLKRRPGSGLSTPVTSGLDTIALRIPAHPVARMLIREAHCPLAAPSANRSGCVSPTTAAHVQTSLGTDVDMILDGGPCRIGIESTIVALDGTTPVLLRPGSITRHQIEECTGRKTGETGRRQKPQAPGMMESHYAPSVPVRLEAAGPEPAEAFLAFGKTAFTGPHIRNLSPGGDPDEAAASLFSCLHDLDAVCTAYGLEGIAVAPVPQQGAGEAVNDRLARAAFPRQPDASSCRTP